MAGIFEGKERLANLTSKVRTSESRVSLRRGLILLAGQRENGAPCGVVSSPSLGAKSGHLVEKMLWGGVKS